MHIKASRWTDIQEGKQTVTTYSASAGLIQAGALVNGTTIVREPNVPEIFTYYHIELASHELILAEGAWTESFVDNADRMSFDNWPEYQALGIAEPVMEMQYPRAKAARQMPYAVRAHLRACAAELLKQHALRAA